MPGPDDDGTDDDRTDVEEQARRAAANRRRLAEVFGEGLPDTTSDERDPDTARETERGDTWLRDQVPPHHGG